jgi:hypothetical protein
MFTNLKARRHLAQVSMSDMAILREARILTAKTVFFR